MNNHDDDLSVSFVCGACGNNRDDSCNGEGLCSSCFMATLPTETPDEFVRTMLEAAECD